MCRFPSLAVPRLERNGERQSDMGSSSCDVPAMMRPHHPWLTWTLEEKIRLVNAFTNRADNRQTNMKTCSFFVRKELRSVAFQAKERLGHTLTHMRMLHSFYRDPATSRLPQGSHDDHEVCSSRPRRRTSRHLGDLWS